MIELFIDNSVCRIQGIGLADLDKLREVACIRQTTGRLVRTKTGKRMPEVRTQYLIGKRGGFPTGLLYLVEEFLQTSKLEYCLRDARVAPKLNPLGVETLYAFRPYEPYPEQKQAAVAAMAHGRGIIVGPTGVGKSAIAAEICEMFKVPTLIVVPSLELKRQLTDGLREVFGKDRVGPLQSGKPSCLITVENVDALDTTRPVKGIDLVIIDEFHHSGAKTYRDLNKTAWSSVYYKFGMTATPFRSRDEERLLLESVLSQVIYQIDYQLAVDKGYIVPLEAYYVDLPAIDYECSASSWPGVYSELVVNREDRNQIIADMTQKLVDAGKSTLVLVKQISHGELLEESLGFGIKFVKGENDDNRSVIKRFSSGQDTGLLGTMGVIGEGVDTKSAEWMIDAGGGKSKNAFMQRVGRVFRRFDGKDSGKIILFRDPSHKWLLAHFNAQVKYLRDEYGIKPTKLEF